MIERLGVAEDVAAGEVGDEAPSMIHVYPTFGRGHVTRVDCWCHPRLEWFDGSPIVVHEVHH